MMIKQDILQSAEAHVRQLCERESSGHDWWHIDRVRRTALMIAEKEKADIFIVELAALLHDVPDRKFNPSLESGLEKVAAFLSSQHLAEKDKDRVLEILATLSFSSYKEGKVVPSLEGQIVQDADRLDALGAIGIARTMAYSGYTGRLIYHPETDEETAIQHFYDKLLMLKDLMNTAEGRHLAAQRQAFMEAYLNQFYAEWRGER